MRVRSVHRLASSPAPKLVIRKRCGRVVRVYVRRTPFEEGTLAYDVSSSALWELRRVPGAIAESDVTLKTASGSGAWVRMNEERASAWPR